jgi:hypothetical protein
MELTMSHSPNQAQRTVFVAIVIIFLVIVVGYCVSVYGPQYLPNSTYSNLVLFFVVVAGVIAIIGLFGKSLNDWVDLSHKLWPDRSEDTLIEEPGSAVTDKNKPSSIYLTPEAQKLLKEGAKDPTGQILVIRSMAGLQVQTNGQQFVNESNPRSEAIWQDAVDKLDSADLIEDKGDKREVFSLTPAGYAMADMLPSLI